MFRYLLIPSKGETLQGFKPYRTAALALYAGSAHALREKIECHFIDVVVLNASAATIEEYGMPLAVTDQRIGKRNQ